ncbi:hypothetical protein [Cellulomonas sp. KRMCY2]|uniref:hypothetical protein n=1 Tax=Cellulomonas sp. KRMCY2 TaxID=1304865 RepID=UPI0018CC6873|nr:hypothetical protein [Cellulomonas sp. KRMCY2]
MGTDPGHFDVLHEGVPPWLADQLWIWIGTQLRVTLPGGGAGWNVGLVRAYETKRRSAQPLAGRVESVGTSALRPVWSADEVIYFIDFLASRLSPESGWSETLERMLSEAGSAWRVGTRDGFPGLERRVALGVQESAEHVMSTAGGAGRRLSEAWHAIFGASPDPSRAYLLAVKAVEDAAQPAISPKDPSATLGKMLRVVRDQGSWSLPLQREHSEAQTGDLLASMMQALWTGQADRHGGGATPEIAITPEAAETAVLLAVTLVHWFTGGHAQRSQSSA